MKHLFFLFLLLSPAPGLFRAQTISAPPSVAKGRIFTTDGAKIVFKDFIPGTDSHSYQDKTTGAKKSLPADQLMRVEQQTGNEAVGWALGLGGAGLLGSILGVAMGKKDIENIGGDAEKVNGAPIIIGLTAASALLGLAIGSRQKKYKTVYSNPKYGTGPLTRPAQVAITCSSSSGLQVGFNYVFK